MEDNIIVKTTAFAAHVVSAYLRPGDIAVDATCGNGWDTLFLCRQTGAEGIVYAFDIQQEALEKAKERFSCTCRRPCGPGREEEEQPLAQVRWILDSHENMDRYLDEGSVSAIVFNLGYLPGGNKELVTRAESSRDAVEKALKLIRKGGIISIVLYPGHGEGRKEKQVLTKLAETLSPSEFHVMTVRQTNQKETWKQPPEILFITRKI